MAEDFSKIYSEERKKEDKETLWVYYVTRPVSFLITPLFLRLGFSANQVSVLGMEIGALSAIFMIVGDYWLVLVGTILLELWLVLDSVDGNVARYRKTPTLLGKFLEEVDGAMMSALFFTSIGFAASKIPGFLPKFLNFPFYIFIILGILTSFLVIFRHLITVHYNYIFSDSKQYSPEDTFNKSSISFLYNIAIKFLGIYSLAQPLLIIAAMFNFLGIYTIVYFSMHLMVTIGTISLLFSKAKKQSQKASNIG